MTRTLSLPVPVGSLESYIQAVNRFPMLSFEEERDLARKFRSENDVSGAPAGAIAPPPGGRHRPRLHGLRIAARRSDPGRQHRSDESGQALRPGTRGTAPRAS